MSLDHLLIGLPIGEVIRSSQYDVVVARVVKVEDRGATNSQPPKVTLQIEEVLRGDPSLDRRRASWNPDLHDVDYGDVESNPVYIQWAATPLSGPATGGRFVLLGSVGDTPQGPLFHVSPAGRFPFSEAFRQQATTAIEGPPPPE